MYECFLWSASAQAQQRIKFSIHLDSRQMRLRGSSPWIPSFVQVRQDSYLAYLPVYIMILYIMALELQLQISLRMIGNLKLKVRAQVKEEVIPNRRIKTEMNENSKKISFYMKQSKMPLAEKKKNTTDNQTFNMKKSKPIKSIALKPYNYSKLNTEAKDQHPITIPQRQAIEQIFANNKKDISVSFNKKDDKQNRDSSRLTGVKRYAFEDKVGSGTFGVVHKARDRLTLQLVAIKRVYQDKKYKNRQLQILKGLNHPNVLKIRDSFFTYEADKQYLNVVMDYYPNNLYESIQKYRQKGDISRLKLKVFAYQMFRGLLYLNKEGIAHRDIKPQNVLVNDINWNLIICDFGSAKKLQPGQANLAYICSRCYRAPELIFGSTNYCTQIDVWSAGCILVQMLTFEPIFRSESNIDQLVEIIKILGTPTFQEIMEMNPLCEMQKYQFPKINCRSWQKVLKKKAYGQQFYDFLYKVLRYSPNRRITPYQALQHPFFNELKDQSIFTKLRKQYQIMDLFDFKVTKQVTASQIANLVPKWYN